MKKRVKGLLTVLGMVFCLTQSVSSVNAAVDVSGLTTNNNASFVTYSPDGRAWTIDEALPTTDAGQYKDNYDFWYPRGEVVTTGVAESLPVVGRGQHLYDYNRRDIIPISAWEVLYREARCIHTQGFEMDWHGIVEDDAICYSAYYSGWRAKCADCGGFLNSYMIYASRDSIRKLQAIDLGKGYYYQCPNEDCRHVEQGVENKDHVCKNVSYNQYKVEYVGNYVGESGELDDTYHMYNNAPTYRGEPAYGCTKYLSDNKHGFTLKGYKVIGWDKTPGDPFGVPDYTVGQEILNLSEDDWNIGKEDGSGRGVITLYAVWGKVEAELTVKPGTPSEISNGAVYRDADAEGATYNASNHSTVIKVPHMGSYVLNNTKLSAPSLGTITFETNGGSAIAPMTVEKTFKSWEKTIPFYGVYNDSQQKYIYAGVDDGRRDVITATWKETSITLPSPTKSGDVFGGWYADPECSIPVGAGGDSYTPSGDVTLYARWSNLVLYSKTDLAVDDWKGGVDLTWNQQEINLFYKLYQQKEGGSWKQLFSASNVGMGTGWASGDSVEAASPGSYSIPIKSTGFYNLYASGAQGSDYGTHTGGLGGYVMGKFWLQNGDTITYSVGARNQGGNGDAGYGGAVGGGATVVKSAKLGTLLVGGGGGGANFYQNGDAGGGVTCFSPTTTEGQNGCGGGGDGFCATGGGGGLGGKVNYHVHTDDCKHFHTGNATTGGGCYVWSSCGGALVGQGDTEYLYTYKNHPNYTNPNPWIDCWDYRADVCVQCGHDPCEGHNVYSDETYVCSRCNSTATSGGRCGVGVWMIGCGKTQGQVLCGKGTDTIESANPAFGGASFVNSAAVLKDEIPGQKAGVGYFKIEADNIGCFDSLELNDVPAHDEEAPDRVDINTVKVMAAEGTNLKVTFDAPEDNGTVYYHYAESYRNADRNTVLSTTRNSPTYNKITEGVWKYYFLLDTNPATIVTESNKQTYNTSPTVKVLVATDVVQYLHIAAVDRAGNVGQTTHVKIEPTKIEWNIATEQIEISSTVNGRNYNGVCANGSNSYYVRADNRTPFELAYQSFVQGTAASSYQIDNQYFEVSCPGLRNEMFETVLPLSDASVVGVVNLDSTLFRRSVSGDSILMDVGHSTASRSNKAIKNNFTQAFIASSVYSGKTILVLPHAGAGYVNADGQRAVKMSDSTLDESNGITLILDGEGPVISGTTPIEGVTQLDLTAGDIPMDISAADALSGLQDVSVTVSNLDDGTSRTYAKGGDGHIRFTISQSISVFNGSFRIEITATDRVGNKTVVKYEPVSMAITANISKIIENGITTYMKNEGAYLNIVTHGYVDKVLIDWPADVLAYNPDLPMEIVYADKSLYTRTERISFVVPYSAVDDQIIEIPVKAVKGAVEKEVRPDLEVQGNLLDNIRYRIK